MWNLDLSDIRTSHCYDSMMQALLRKYDLDEDMFFLNSFQTEYILNDSENLGNALLRESTEHTDTALKELFGLEIDHFRQVEKPQINSLIRQELIRNPVGVSLDAHDCSWSPFYHRNRLKHFVLIIGIDDAAQQYVCVDAYYKTVGIFKCDDNALEQIIQDVIAIRNPSMGSAAKDGYGEIGASGESDPAPGSHSADRVHRSVISTGDVNRYIDFLKKRYISHDPVKEQENYERTINRFVRNIKSSDIGDSNSLDTSVLLVKLNFFAEDKKNFAFALGELDKRLGHMMPQRIFDLLNESSQSFLQLKSIMIKLAITGLMMKDKSHSIVDRIFNNDREIITILKQVLCAKEDLT